MENFNLIQSKQIFSIYARMLGIERKFQAHLTSQCWDRDPWHWWGVTYSGGVVVGPGYFRLNKRGQIALLIHELLHIKYPPGKRRRKYGNRTHVHSGRWKQAALKWGERVLFVHDDDILPQWRAHPYAKDPSPPEGCHCLRCKPLRPETSPTGESQNPYISA